MKRSRFAFSSFSSTVAALGVAASVGLASSAALAQYPEPPAEVVATTAPVYFEGHAAYWYGNRWFYRDNHGAWQHYEKEPPALAERRNHSPPPRKNYGGHPSGHGGRR